MTSPQNDVRIAIGYALDESSVNRTDSALKGTDKNIVAIGAQAKAGSREIGLLARAYANAAESSQDATKAVNDSVDALRDEAKAAEDSADAIAKRNKQLDNTPDADDTRKQFSSESGDRASIAGQTRGALDALTGGNAGAVGQALEGAEAIFDLGEAATKLPGPIGGAVTALGPAGLAGVAAGAGVALVAINIGLALYAKEAQKARDVQKAYTASLKETIDLLSSDEGTSENLAQQREELVRNLEVAQQTTIALKNVREERNAENSTLEDIFNATRVLTDGRRKQLNQDIGAAETEEHAAEAALEAHDQYVASMGGAAIAANDAAAAERSLAEARTASLLTEASQAGELESLRLRAVDLTQEQIDAELKALEIREASLNAELKTLEASGDTSDDVKDKIAALTEQLGFLGEQADVLKSARPQARSEAAEKRAEEARQEREKQAAEAERAREKQAQEAQRAADEARRAQEQYTNAVASAKTAFKDAKADIKTGLIDSLQDINQDLEDSLNEQSIEFNQSELKEEAQFQRDLAGIRRDAKRSELDATRQRDFAAVREARENAAEAIADRKDDERAANDEQLTEFKQAQEALGRERDLAARDAELDARRQLRDAAIARDRSTRDAAAANDAHAKMQNNFYNNSLGMAQKYYDQLAQLQSRAMSSSGDSRTSTRQSTSRSTSPALEDMLQYVYVQG